MIKSLLLLFYLHVRQHYNFLQVLKSVTKALKVCESFSTKQYTVINIYAVKRTFLVFE